MVIGIIMLKYIQKEEVKFDDLSVLFLPWINASNHASTMKKIEQSRVRYLHGSFRDCWF